MELGEGGAGGVEGVVVGIADPRHQVPVVAGRARQRQRRPRRDHPQPPLGVERVGQPQQVALVGAAPVVEDEQALGLARRPGARSAAAPPSGGRGGRGLVQVVAHELVEVAVEHPLHVADLVLGAVVLDHRVGVQDVAADLRAPGDVFDLAPRPAPSPRPVCAPPARSASSAGTASPPPCSGSASARSGTGRRRPVGMWVIRTAESVLLTCWPPAPEAR